MGKWLYKIPEKYATSLRDAIDDGDAEAVQGYLLGVCKWIIDNIPELADKAEDIFDQVYYMDSDEDEDFEENLDYALEDFYDLCDSYRIWIPL